MDIKDCFLLGMITKPYGFKGDVVFFVDADEPHRYGNLESIWIETSTGLVPFFFQSLRSHSDRFVAHLEGVDTEAEAQRLSGCKVYLPEKLLVPLDESAFYFHEAKGWTLHDLETVSDVGTIERVLDHGAYPLLEVDCDGKEVLVPLPDHLEIIVERDAGVLKVRLPLGLLDVYLLPSENDEGPDENASSE